jgi:DNA-directed RNA polymerase specialized sigma24 family protein
MIPPAVLVIAERVLTEKQLEAFRLEQAGFGMMRVARHLGISKGAAHERVYNAHKKLRKEGLRMDGSGKWLVDEEVAA